MMFDQSVIMWSSFLITVVILLALDLGVFNKENKVINFKKSISLSLFYIAIAVIFGIWIGIEINLVAAKEYFTGYLIEKSLSIDNIFVISLVFSYFNIPAQYKHKILFWGIVGVIILRAIMIALGAALLEEFQWTLYFFGAFLVITGFKMFSSIDHKIDFTNNPIINLTKKFFPVTDQLHEDKFFVQLKDQNNSPKIHITPLFMALILIEFIDLIFAIDSVPAIFAVTQDPYIVYTSNIFAVLGLRALYFALADIIHRFKYLKYSLAAILIFIGGKVFAVNIVGKISASFSLTITLLLLFLGVIASLYKSKFQNKL